MEDSVLAQKKSATIKKYRKPLNINLGIVIFSVIFVYIIICIIMYFNSKHIVGYEVTMGSLSESKVYQGIAMRDEQVYYCNNAGYINYYSPEGKRVGFGDLIYTVDETGQLADMAGSSDATTTGSLSSEDLSELKNQIITFRTNFNDHDFSSVYDFKSNVNGTVLKLANSNILDNIATLESSGSSDLINYGKSDVSGIVIYSMDGDETLTDDQLSSTLFDQSKYKKQQLINNELVASGDPVYKLSLSEDWSIAIQVDAAKGAELLEDGYVKVKFLKTQDVSWGKVSIVTNGDETFAKLTFSNSMINYCTDRFIDIELVTNDETGLKIPNSSIVEKEFFLIPQDYLITSGTTEETGFMRTGYDEKGNATTEFVNADVYNLEDSNYYIDDSSLRIGDVLQKPDSLDTYTVSKRGTLIGVYNMNKGYADFKRITILYQNEEYSVVQSNTAYGLSVYDYIVLDAKSVNENDFIYE